MNIGDRVRLVHSSEEGIITKILDNKIIEVEIEDGFHIPVKMSEVAVVSQEEDIRFGKDRPNLKPQPTSESKDKVLAFKGIYTAFTAINDRAHSLYLINNTDFDMPFVVGTERGDRFQSLLAGVLKSRTHIKIAEVNIADLDTWATYIFQFLFHQIGFSTPREPFTRRIRYRPHSFFKSKAVAPLLNKEAYLIQLDSDEKLNPLTAEVTDSAVQQKPIQQKNEQSTQPKIDVEKLKAGMFEKAVAEPQKPEVVITKPALEVDLHIETLTKNYAQMNASEMLQVQLANFEKSLENAIATGMRDIIFIHGVGNGTLRTEIHRRLSGHPAIKFFQDARKEKFGYGATSVTFK